MAENKSSDDIAKLSFEDALEQLETIVRTLEGGEARLDDAIGAYERGIALKTHCEAKLSEAKARIEKIAFTGSDPAGLEPTDID